MPGISARLFIGKKVLRMSGKKEVIIDFETRSPHNIKDVGMYKYLQDAELLCVAWKILGYDIVEYVDFQNFSGYERPLERLKNIAKSAEYTFHAHNAQFEMMIWYRIMVPKYDMPAVHPLRWRCTAASAAAKGLPRALDKAGESLNLDNQKDKTGAKSMLRLSIPQSFIDGKPVYVEPTFDEMEPVIDYCMKDVLAEEELLKHVGDLSPEEQSVFVMDFRINSTGVLIDRELCTAAIQSWNNYCESQNEKLHEITGGEITSYTQNVAMVHWVNKQHNLGLESATAADIDEMLKQDIPSAAKKVLEIRRQTAKTSIAKFSKMLYCAEKDNRVRGCHIYHGASTGRFSGALVQFQNIKRGTLKDSEIEQWIETLKASPESFLETCEMFDCEPGEVLSSLIRSAICAYPGNKLLVCDFAGIEARGVAWLAGQDDLVTAFVNKSDIYVQFAAQSIYGVPEASVTKDQRFVGKQAILGCGYGMGAKRFKEQCESYGVTLQLDFCEQVIGAYRNRYSKISKLWKDVEHAAVQAVKHQGEHAAANGKVKFKTRTVQGNTYLVCVLPSGREICYFLPDLEPGKFGNDQITFMSLDSQTYKFRRESTYGGKLVENIVQGLCRDLLVNALKNLNSNGYEVIFHVHDEVICEVPDHRNFSIAKMQEFMEKAPAWAKGFPIATEGFEAKRYRK